MHDFVGEGRFQFCGFQLINKRRIEGDPAAIGCHGGHRTGHELQPQAQGSEEWLIEQKLRPGPCQLLFSTVLNFHVLASDALAAGIPYPATYPDMRAALS